jgi:hypothetical protein
MAAAASDIQAGLEHATSDRPTDVLVQGDGRAFSSPRAHSTVLQQFRITLNPSKARGEHQCLYCAADYHTRASRHVRFNDADDLSGDWKFLNIVTGLAVPTA